MPIPSTVSNRITAAIAAVSESTDLDLLISLIDVGQRSGVNISVASAELLRRANLVDANTDSITASKIAAGLFKIDYPVADLWNGNSSGGGAIEVGQLVSGFFTGNPKYVSANGSRYLVSAYPDMAPLLTAGALPTYYDPVQTKEAVLQGRLDNNAWREMGTYVDGQVIFVPQQPTSTGRGYMLGVSQDGGATWRGALPNSAFTAAVMPEANGWGFSDSGSKQILDICKLDVPGRYAALISGALSNASLRLIITDDYGVTWRGWYELQNSQSPTAPLNYHLFYRNGVLLYVGAGVARYSVDLGVTWVTLTQSQWNGGTASAINVSADGILTIPDGTTGFYHLTWPATPAGWSAAIAWTTAASKFATNCSNLKKCGNFWVAWLNTGNVLYVSSTLTGTYTSNTLSGITMVRDVNEYNGVFYFIVNTSTGPALYSATAATTITGTFAVLAQTLTPALQSGTATLRWPMPSLKFGFVLGSVDGVYFRHARESIAKITAPTGAGNVVAIYHAQPSQQQPLFCRKYGMWFCSIPQHDANYPTSWQNYVDVSIAMLHYRSTDGDNWIPIGTGRSGIIDAGNRLLRLNGAHLLEQSTDGVTWDTTGITRPTIATAPLASRLWRAKDRVYYHTSNSTSDNSSAVFLSSGDGGATWQTVTGFTNGMSCALVKGGITHYQGQYYAMEFYNSASPGGNPSQGQVDSFRIMASTDGIAFTSIYSTSVANGSVNYAHSGFLLSGSVLYVMPGSVSGSTQQLPLVTGNGRTFVQSVGALVTQQWSASQCKDFDCSNGELRWYMDRSLTVNSTSVRAIDLFKGNVTEATIITTTQQLTQYASIAGTAGDLLACSASNLFRFSPASAAFMAPQPGTATQVPFPFLRVAN